MERPFLSKDLKAFVAAVLVVAGWAVSYGILLQKVDDQGRQLTALSEKFDRYIFKPQSLSTK